MRPQLNHVVIGVVGVLATIVAVALMLPHFGLMQNASKTPTLAPRWIEDGHRYQTCTQAMEGTPAPKARPAIDVYQAAQLGAEIIAHQTKLHDRAGHKLVAFPPQLVEKRFPDGVVRLAWVYGEGRVIDNNSMMAKAAFVYLEATTGDPLLLITDMNAGDPVFTCGQLFLNY